MARPWSDGREGWCPVRREVHEQLIGIPSSGKSVFLFVFCFFVAVVFYFCCCCCLFSWFQTSPVKSKNLVIVLRGQLPPLHHSGVRGGERNPIHTEGPQGREGPPSEGMGNLQLTSQHTKHPPPTESASSLEFSPLTFLLRDHSLGLQLLVMRMVIY